MTAPSRFLAWLVLPLLALCSSNLLADTVEGAPQALHLLDYIGADYPQSVEAGNVINESEYREQLEFAKVLQGLVAAMPDKPEKAGLEQGVSALQRAIAARQVFQMSSVSENVAAANYPGSKWYDRAYKLMQKHAPSS